MAGEQISVSRETLRAELGELHLSLSGALAQLELRLIDRLADKAELAATEAKLEALKTTALIKGGPVERKLENLHERVHDLEGSLAGREILLAQFGETVREVGNLTGWRNRTAGGLLVVATIAGATSAHVWFGF